MLILYRKCKQLKYWLHATFNVHWKPLKLYYFKIIGGMLFVHKHRKTYYEGLFDNITPIFTIFYRKYGAKTRI